MWELIGQKVFRLRLRTHAHFHELWGGASKHADAIAGPFHTRLSEGKKIQAGLDTANIHVNPQTDVVIPQLRGPLVLQIWSPDSLSRVRLYAPSLLPIGKSRIRCLAE